MTLYFAYGSNMSRTGMAARCPDARALGVAVLDGWRFIIGADGYASIVPSSGGRVRGVLWRLTASDLAALNAYESLDSGLYRHRRLTVRHGGGARTALVYIARGHAEGRPRPGYLEGVLAAARAWNLADDYIERLRRWASSGRCSAGAAKAGEPA